MDNELCVSCHAPSFSLLLFETVRSAHDQKGLLIGEVCKETIIEKTDENEMNREQRTTVYVEHCIPVKDMELFGSVGEVNKQKFEKYIDQYCGKVVGWYSFRRNTRVNSRTLHEILTHKSLIQSIHHIKPEHFVVAFMSASIGANFSTHTYNHIFMRVHPMRGSFEPLKLKIYTMSDKRINMNGYPIWNSFPTSKNFENIIRPSQEQENPVLSVLTINRAIAEYLKTISGRLQEAEKSRRDLEQEIKALRKRLLLDKLQEIQVGKLNVDRARAGIQYVRYNENINYNPDRKENPIKVIPVCDTPRVPEKCENYNYNKRETRKSSFPKRSPSYVSSKTASPGGRASEDINTGSGSNNSDFKSQEEIPILNLNSLEEIDREGASAGGRMPDFPSDLDGEEESVHKMEKRKIPGSAQYL